MIFRICSHRARTRVVPPAHVVAGLILLLLGALVSGPGIAPRPVDASEGVPCQPGSYSFDGYAPCDPAPAGSYVATDGATQATPCPAGTFSSISGAAACTFAPAGRYVADEGATEATPCPAGTFSEFLGAIACTEAPPGTYVADEGATEATACAPGTYQDQPGQTSCNVAPAGSYVPGFGYAFYINCPAGTTSAAGAIECQSTQVLYDFTGFLAPIDNAPTLNVVKAGSAVPVKFGLGGDQGLGILAAGAPSSRPVTCDSGVPMSTDTPATSAGASSLTYDPATGQYTYVWKTDKSWAGSCRQLELALADGSVHTALFKFK